MKLCGSGKGAVNGRASKGRFYPSCYRRQRGYSRGREGQAKQTDHESAVPPIGNFLGTGKKTMRVPAN